MEVKTVNVVDKNKCTGCWACVNNCPKNCIFMKTAEDGFKYPSVDSKQCVNCGLCLNNCPVMHKNETFNHLKNPKVFAAWSNDEEIRLNSTSGGIFSELANIVLERNGILVGAQYNEKHLVEHVIVHSKQGLKKIRQSKYIQSDMGFVYRDVKQLLSDGRLVVFCAAPCQVAGLVSVLGNCPDNLLLIDFVCRGTNSPKAYVKYLEYLEKKYRSKVKRVWFKNKTYGWNRFSTRIDFLNGKKYIKDRYTDLFMRGYIEQNLYMRDCCEACLFKDFPRQSDITLADFWGVSHVDTALDEDKGTSLVMINSDKGFDFFSLLGKRIYARECKIEDAVKENNCIFQSAKKNRNSTKFLRLLDKFSFPVAFLICSDKKKTKKRIENILYNKIYRPLFKRNK
ncbi:MAG: Coenzyme F420 hydrogenase/dehydrogenase, beta subunit C-terminal domain [Clostridium sp.]|nr:Coenzyme F420 hydrogenase/dehydrogenase, beta subunit C-terminal domain [Clostridium sp.]